MGSFVINLVWLCAFGHGFQNLVIGYYLWAVSFLFLGISALWLSRQTSSDHESALLKEPVGVRQAKAIQAGVGLLLFAMIAIAASTFVLDFLRSGR